MGRHCEVIYDEDGNVLARVQLTGPITDEEREALRELILFARKKFAEKEEEHG